MNHTIINKILSMKTIAIVGISPNLNRPSHLVANYMLHNGYNILPVNPGHKKILDIKCYSALKDIPHKVDIVNIFRNSDFVLPIIRAAVSIKTRAIWLQDGIVSEEDAIIAKNKNILFVMNDCISRQHINQNA